LNRESGIELILGFNEFCGPSLDEALASAVERGADRVIVVTPMLTRGGGHAERDIPAGMARARAAFAGVEFVYAWPFDEEAVVRLLADRIRSAAGWSGAYTFTNRAVAAAATAPSAS
jgi:sirohydrochlorin ferrochelatase